MSASAQKLPSKGSALIHAVSQSLSIPRRVRATPYTSRVNACGVKGLTVYNHTLLATVFRDMEEDYWHLCQNVQVWDVSCERQVEIKGPDSKKLVQLMSVRDLSKAKVSRCFYTPLCDTEGKLLNDPIVLKHNDDHWWLSIADNDVILYARGLATGLNLDVEIGEADIWPLAVQGPYAEELVSRVFGDVVKKIKFFGVKRLEYMGKEMLVARSGWSKQGGFEIYVNDAELGGMLWDELFEKGEDLNVGPGCPNLIERIESGLMSFGSDMAYDTTPLEVGMDKYVSFDTLSDSDSMGIKALRNKVPTRQLKGVTVNSQVILADHWLYAGDERVGEIRSEVWNPRHQCHTGFVLCDLKKLDEYNDFYVRTLNFGDVSAIITDIPFDFSRLHDDTIQLANNDKFMSSTEVEIQETAPSGFGLGMSSSALGVVGQATEQKKQAQASG